MPPAPDWPEGWGVRLSPSTRRVGADRLVGGAPPRVVRVSDPGALDALPAVRSARVARSLTDGGLGACLPADPPPGGWPSWSLVVPVRDRADGLAVTLASVRSPVEPSEVVVVDDGSLDPFSVRAAAGSVGARVVRLPASVGPAGARNAGAAVATGEVVVFVDADCLLDSGAVGVLLTHFADASLAAVAPRVRSVPGPSVLARYEVARSPLDMGASASPVRPGAQVPYVPTACLAVRRAAFEAASGFDAAMRVGEDVDLVWRLHGLGWRVRYDPTAGVAHPPRATWAAWARQRRSYGGSAAPLAARHGAAVAPWRGGAKPLAGPAAAVAGGALWWPVASAVSVAVSAWRLTSRLGLPTGVALRMAGGAELRAADATAGLVRRAWGPLLVGAWPWLGRRLRRRVATLAVAPLLVEWATGPAARRIDPLRWVAVRLADDLAYAAGVVGGCVRHRAIAPLVPSLVRRSGSPDRR